MSERKPKFDISISGDQLHVQRTLVLPEGVIDLDLTYIHSTPRNQLKLEEIHDSSLEIAIRYLQSLRTKEVESQDSQQPAASA